MAITKFRTTEQEKRDEQVQIKKLLEVLEDGKKISKEQKEYVEGKRSKDDIIKNNDAKVGAPAGEVPIGFAVVNTGSAGAIGFFVLVTVAVLAAKFLSKRK